MGDGGHDSHAIIRSRQAAALSQPATRVFFEHANYRLNTLVPLPEWVPTARNRRFVQARKVLYGAVTSMIEPIMIICMGGVVGFIAMAIILPIFKMSQVVK